MFKVLLLLALVVLTTWGSNHQPNDLTFGFLGRSENAIEDSEHSLRKARNFLQRDSAEGFGDLSAAADDSLLSRRSTDSDLEFSSSSTGDFATLDAIRGKSRDERRAWFKKTSPVFSGSSTLKAESLQRHGTTTIAFKNNDSVIICVDSKASIGDYVGSRTVKKAFPVSSHIVATMAGGAADCAYWINRVSRVCRNVGYKYGLSLPVSSVAKVLASTLREYKGAGLSVGTMVAGFDATSGPGLFYVDSEGSCLSGDLFCVGSGSTVAYAILDSFNEQQDFVADEPAAYEMETEVTTSAYNQFPTINANANAQPDEHVNANANADTTSPLSTMKQSRAIEVAVQAVRHATLRDGYSGGYINVIVVNSTGIHHIKRIDSRKRLISTN
jgi:20S proteasome alpha/beta subunit